MVSYSAFARLSLAALGTAALISAPASATSGLAVDSPDMMTPQAIYQSGPSSYVGTTVVIDHMTLEDPVGPLATHPTPSPGAAVDSFFDITYRIDLSTGVPPSVPSTGTATCQVRITNTGAGGGGGGAGGIFDTEMLSLDLTGAAFKIRESPTRPSQGQTSIAPIGGGMYHIDSFFDIFTELSLDGGQTWHPAQESSRLTLTGQTPEPASMSLLAIGAAVLLRRLRR